MKTEKSTKTKAAGTPKTTKKIAGNSSKKAGSKVKSPAKKSAGTPKKSASAKAKNVSKMKLTRIVAHVDVGWGRMLYIRGEGAGLSWEQGVPMLCENDTEWHWLAETGDGPISFKFLIDDRLWALGENISINAGDVHISEPRF